MRCSILLAKLLVTVLCIGFGFAGGVIFPIAVNRRIVRCLYALMVPEWLFDDYSGLSVYAVCGMMAVMSPVIGAPMTALLLVFELTRSYEFTIAAMVAIVFSNLIAHRWYGRSLYDHQLNPRDRPFHGPGACLPDASQGVRPGRRYHPGVIGESKFPMFEARCSKIRQRPRW